MINKNLDFPLMVVGPSKDLNDKILIDVIKKFNNPEKTFIDTNTPSKFTGLGQTANYDEDDLDGLSTGRSTSRMIVLDSHGNGGMHFMESEVVERSKGYKLRVMYSSEISSGMSDFKHMIVTAGYSTKELKKEFYMLYPKFDEFKEIYDSVASDDTAVLVKFDDIAGAQFEAYSTATTDFLSEVEYIRYLR